MENEKKAGVCVCVCVGNFEQRGSNYTLPLKCHFETETFLLVLKLICRLCQLCGKDMFLKF